MLLNCPNCSAQYQVPAGVIPREGREVQCSNCGQSWFQEGEGPPPRDADGPPADAEARRPMADEATLDVLREERAHEARARAAERRRSRAVTRALPTAPPAPATEPEDVSGSPGRSERARVAAAAEVARRRRAEEGSPPADGKGAKPRDPGPAPTPPAPSPDRRQKPAVPTVEDDLSSVIARTVSAVGKPERAPPPKQEIVQKERPSRRSLLPDIEEINSSLRPDDRLPEIDEASERPSQHVQPPTSGFGLGFAAMVVAAFALVALYALSGVLIEAAPFLSGPLGFYADWVDGLRAGLEARVDAFTSRIMPEF